MAARNCCEVDVRTTTATTVAAVGIPAFLFAVAIPFGAGAIGMGDLKLLVSVGLLTGLLAGSSVVVPDTLRALEALGLAARDRTPARRGAVTGSVGKTSVTQAVKAGLDLAGPAMEQPHGEEILQALSRRIARLAFILTRVNKKSPASSQISGFQLNLAVYLVPKT